MLITKIFKFMNLTTLKNTVSRATGGKHKNKQIKKKKHPNTSVLSKHSFCCCIIQDFKNVFFYYFLPL